MVFYALEPITSTFYHIQHYHLQDYQHLNDFILQRRRLGGWFWCGITRAAVLLRRD